MFLQLVIPGILIWVLVAQVCLTSENSPKYIVTVHAFSAYIHFNKIFIKLILAFADIHLYVFTLFKQGPEKTTTK